MQLFIRCKKLSNTKKGLNNNNYQLVNGVLKENLTGRERSSKC